MTINNLVDLINWLGKPKVYQNYRYVNIYQNSLRQASPFGLAKQLMPTPRGRRPTGRILQTFLLVTLFAPAKDQIALKLETIMKNLKHCDDERIQTDGITAVVTAGLFLRVKKQ